MDGAVQSHARRQRSSTSASTSITSSLPITGELRELVRKVFDRLPKARRAPSSSALEQLADTLRNIRQLLIDSDQPVQARDAFRHANGFKAVLEPLRSLDRWYRPDELSGDERSSFWSFFKAALDVLSESLNDHAGNRRYFAKRVEGGGWAALEDALRGLGLSDSEGPVGDLYQEGQERFFSHLMAFALGEESVAGPLRAAKEALSQEPLAKDPAAPAVLTTSESIASRIEAARDALRKQLDGREMVRNAEVIPCIFRTLQSTQFTEPISSAVLSLLLEVSCMSAFNAVAIHSTSILGTLVLDGLEIQSPSLHSYATRSLVKRLLPFGFDDPSSAQFLFQCAAISKEASLLLLSSMRASGLPSFIQFDLSLHGYSSVEIPSLGSKPFPPTSSMGYTILAWLNIGKFDTNCHTNIFGAYDIGQKCFVLAYVDKDNKNFTLQTATDPSKPLARFQSTTFVEGKWYHIALVHRRAKGAATSRASLFIDGQFTEQVKCPYPSSPAVVHSSTESFPSLSSRANTARPAPVQAFLGTPQDLATRLGRSVTTTRWSLASFHLIADAISDEVITVYQKLGPRYSGNFQDCLGSFQTYQASAELNLYNELLHPGKEERSEIVTAIKGKGSSVMPEDLLVLSISALNVLDDNDRNNVDESQLIKLLSKPAAKNLARHIRSGNAIVLNAAVPSMNEALVKPNGVAILVGHPVVAAPQPLDDMAWRLGGCVAICLKLIELAEDDDAVLRAVDILFAAVEGNWRNSEAMERDNGSGFASLILILREKLGLGVIHTVENSDLTTVRPRTRSRTREELQHFSMELLIRILRFVGYNDDRPEESVIINPLAFRVMLLDFDTWIRMPVGTQQMYYKQFGVFVEKNKYCQFNAKRLFRIRIIKRLVDPLKAEVISRQAVPDLTYTLRTLLRLSTSADTLRALALFITYALHDARSSATRRARTMPIHPYSDPATPPSWTSDQDHIMSKAEIGTELLEMYTSLLCQAESSTEIKRFAKTVTNKWLLYLLAEPSPQVVFLATKILARLLFSHGPPYLQSFHEKSGGFAIMRRRLRTWWNVPAIWTVCFAILFGQDVAQLDFEQEFNHMSLVDVFKPQELKIAHPEILPVIAALLEAGLQAIVNGSGKIKTSVEESNGLAATQAGLEPPEQLRPRSMSLRAEQEDARKAGAKTPEQQIASEAEVLHTVIHFLADTHSNSPAFRTFALTSSYVQELLFLLYPIMVTSGIISAGAELDSRESLYSPGRTNIISPLKDDSNPRIATADAADAGTDASSAGGRRATPLRRASSFVLLAQDSNKQLPLVSRLASVMSKIPTATVSLQVGHALIEKVLDIIVAVFLDQILHRKDFSGFGLFLKVPPGNQEHQAYFETYVLRFAMDALARHLKQNTKTATEPRVLTNVAKYSLHMAEAVFEGWFLDGTELVLDFIGTYLEFLQKPEIAQLKDVRLCGNAVATMRGVLFKVALLRLSELQESDSQETVKFLNKLTFWQTVILATDVTQSSWLRLICFLLYTRLLSPNEEVRCAAANFWRMLLVQKPQETSELLDHHVSASQSHLCDGFASLAHTDNDTFLKWIGDHQTDLNALFYGNISTPWEAFVKEQNATTEDSATNRLKKRRDKLRQWQLEELQVEEFLKRHESSTPHWRHNVHAAERLKHQRALQDHQENLTFTAAALARLRQKIEEPVRLFPSKGEPLDTKWQLDETEGRNRMRMRIIRDRTVRQDQYQPKRRNTNSTRSRPKVDTNVPLIVATKDIVGVTPATLGSPVKMTGEDVSNESNRPRSNSQQTTTSHRQDDDYEIVDGPDDDEEEFDDKKRRVQRSLQMNDCIVSVCNVARIVGLEAVEGLLVLGKDNLYMLDDFFERSDKEVVRSWQAPAEERDPYLQMISGQQQATLRRPNALSNGRASRHWQWSDVLSMSKRRFLFREVGIELFFTDGRSYLLTLRLPHLRDELYAKLVAKAPHVHGSTSALETEERRRLESLRNPDEVPQSIGSKFASVFNQAPANPATKRWLRGELSNFAYLMLINTMAGRTFNDLTQYPVFPWVLSDYTSEELDLADPKSYRDLSKPMGCQTRSREIEFRERYHTFAEMGDEPPFHYGTHYSSAMIVTSYLIRLQPFVQSYLLLQGGSFDHADRLFYSVEKTWLSASRDNMTDVRELTPEFFYLADFLVNTNGYNFGAKETTGERINDVILPPWAKGDPHIFINKHREALESPYVTAHLHQWIDLVFGSKQRGDLAVEATNVFHHLSYHGATDLDSIQDRHERLATIGIIHNFGQTPLQVFQRSHPRRDLHSTYVKRVDNSPDSLVRLPFALLETEDCISSLLYSVKQDKLFCSAAFRLNIPPAYERYMEWGFADGSVRFFSTETRKLVGLFEHLHQGQISTATFADSTTFITAGVDCVVSIWNLRFNSKNMELQPRVAFFGHRAPVTVLATARSFSTLLSASIDGKVYLWDLNRSEFVCELNNDGRKVQCAKINSLTGNILLGCGTTVLLFSLNGKLLIEQDVFSGGAGDDHVISCAFYEGIGNEWLDAELIFTGHARGVVNVWRTSIADDGKWMLALVKRLDHAEPRLEKGVGAGAMPAGITCIMPSSQAVYTGDEDGKVYEWDLVKHG